MTRGMDKDMLTIFPMIGAKICNDDLTREVGTGSRGNERNNIFVRRFSKFTERMLCVNEESPDGE